MRDYNNRGRSGGGRSDGGRSGGRNSGRSDFGGDRQMHDAICDECGNRCRLPFKPSGDKPVYCSDCFRRKEDSGSGGRGRDSGRDRGRGGDRGGDRGRGGFDRRDSRRDFRRSDSRDRELHDAICDECGEHCTLPFKPSGDKPVYCSDCFGANKGGSSESKKSDQNKEQFEALNAKMDEIIRTLEIIQGKKKLTIKKEVEEKEDEKEKTPTKATKAKKEEKETKVKKATKTTKAKKVTKAKKATKTTKAKKKVAKK